MTWLDRVDPADVNHPILMTSKFPSTKCLWLGASGFFYRVRVSNRVSEGQRGAAEEERGKEEDICNTNRSLSLPLTIGLEEHQEQHVY